MEALEHLILCNDKSYISRFKTTPILSQDEDTCQDLIMLMSALVMLGEQLSEETKTEIERELYHLRSPDIIIDDLLSKLMLEPDDPVSILINCYSIFLYRLKFSHVTCILLKIAVGF